MFRRRKLVGYDDIPDVFEDIAGDGELRRAAGSR